MFNLVSCDMTEVEFIKWIKKDIKRILNEEYESIEELKEELNAFSRIYHISELTEEQKANLNSLEDLLEEQKNNS